MEYTRLLFKRLAIILVLFTTCRVLFYLFNRDLFSGGSFTDFLWILFVGLRFDISAIIYLNILFILLHIIPNPWRGQPIYQGIVKVLFYISASFSLLFSVADIGYFRYSLKRTTYDVFSIAGDFLELLSKYLIDFWYLVLILVGMLVVVEVLYRRIKLEVVQKRSNYFLQSLYFLLIFLLLGIMARGGLQYIPISPITSVKYVPVSLSPLVTNTPFVFLYSLEHRGIEELTYYDQEELATIYSIYHKNSYPDTVVTLDKNSEKPNIVLIILESMSKEYSGYMNTNKGYTPFLDSLMQNGLLCTNGYANGKHSNEGLVAITASIPALMTEPFINSVYQDNNILGIGTILKEYGYRTGFFHGGNNGTFGFDYFSKSAGFDEYYGKEEYNNDSDDDGYWGIYDEPFFQYFADEINTFEEPFCVSFFSLTSHHPYSLPEKYEGKLDKGEIDIHESIGYTDHALRKFFATASQMDWFDNTLFIITADHTGPSESDAYKTKVGVYSVPILFYKPNSIPKGEIDFVVQHTDLMPSLLDYLKYNEPYTGFGSSIFSTSKPKLSFSYLNNLYQIIDNEYALLFDGREAVAMYAYKTDKLLKNDLLKDDPQSSERLVKQCKAIIQQYNSTLINNQLLPK